MSKPKEKVYTLTTSQLKNIVSESIRRYKLAESDQEFEEECLKDATALINSFTPKATKIEDNGEYFSVRLSNEDEKNPFDVWMDISIKDNDVVVDWNQYMFALTNSKDVIAKMFQEDDNMFDICSSEAVYALENAGYIKQEENGEWHLVDKSKSSEVQEECGGTPKVAEEEANRGIMVGGGAAKEEDPAEVEFVKQKFREFAKQNLWPHFIAYNMETNDAIPCHNYATAAQYKGKGYKIAGA